MRGLRWPLIWATLFVPILSILLTWFFLSITWSLINLIGNGVIIPVSYELKGVNVPEVNITFLGCWSLMKLNPAAGFRHWKLNIKSKRVIIKLR